MVDKTTEHRWQPSQTTLSSSVKSPLIDDNNHADQVTILKDDSTQTHAIVTTPRTTPATPKRLTGKQREFIRLFLEQPTESLYKIAAQAGYTGNAKTLTETARENLEKPGILAELAKHSDMAEITLVEVMNKSKKEMYNTDRARAVDWANTARQSANDLLDRVHGKATQKSETTTKAVVLNIDLTGATGASS